MKRLNTENIIKTILLLGAMVFVATFTLAPFLHDHEADFEEHHSCPSHIIEFFLTTLVFHFFITFFLFYASEELLVVKTEILSTFYSSSFFHRRAPPQI